MASGRVVVVGAGIGGLVAALQLAGRGLDVVVLERAATPGGKMRELTIDGAGVDAGPTVFTMRWVLDEILAEAGTSLDEQVVLRPLDVLARHAWDARGHLDLFADKARCVEAIGQFAGPTEARGYIAFCARARDIYATLEQPFLRAPRGGPLGLAHRVGFARLPALWRIAPFATLWRAIGQHFRDPRLCQLFARYATYCGSSPFASPATLMLVAHVEQEGVWSVEGGMFRIAEMLVRVATARGARFRFAAEVAEVLTTRSHTCGVRLTSGECVAADAVIVNADVAAITSGLFGAQVKRAVPPVAPSRSLSAVTWAMRARTSGFPMSRHNVFFGGDYREEFDAIFRRRELPTAPTVYVCAQDRGQHDRLAGTEGERLLCLVNAPATGDSGQPHTKEIEQCEERAFSLLARCGLEIQRRATHTTVTTPREFAQLFPATGGALYGRASHGWRASFQRPGARTRVPGLYLAGGSTHPGPGVPMAALSGRMAAATLLSDLPSTHRSRPAATPGGTSIPYPTTDSTA